MDHTAQSEEPVSGSPEHFALNFKYDIFAAVSILPICNYIKKA